MKLLLLADASSVHTARWADWFSGRGHQVTLASLEAGGRRPDIALPRRGRFAWFRYPAAAPGVKRLAEKLRPDLVNAHFVSNYGFLAALAGARPLAISAWGSDLLVSARRSFLHRARARWALSRADLVTCDGQVLAEELVRLGVPPGKILDVPMGVDRGLIADRRGGLPQSGPVNIVSTRSLEPVYDVATVIRSAAETKRRSARPIKMTFVGDGSLRSSLEGLARELGLEAGFTGRLEHGELIGQLDRAEVYVSASLSDSTSVSLLEAMARGAVPVVSDIPGNREWVEDGVNGLLFRPGDHAGLAEKLLFIINNKMDIAKVRERNRVLVEKRGCRQVSMAAVEAAFDRLIGKAAG